MKNTIRKILEVVLTLTITVAFILLIGVIIKDFTFNDHEYYNMLVTDKQVKTVYSGKSTTSKYLIFTKDKTGQVVVFENTEQLLRSKLNSSDFYGMLEINKRYDIKCIGIRDNFMSWYENILDIKEVK